MKETLDLSDGANFHKSDLHLHTPGDKGFRCPPGTLLETEDQKSAFARTYLGAAKTAGLQVIAVTDHNSVEWVDSMRVAGQQAGIAVFPGFEIGTRSGADGIHLVCLFEPERPKDELDDLITQMGLRRGERFHSDGSPKLCNKDIDETIEFVQSNGGLSIAAHAQNENGLLRSMKGEIRIQVWINPQLRAAEMSEARSVIEAGDSFVARVLRNESELHKRKRPIACIYCSDARSLDEIGSRSTWIKFSSTSIEGLKQAFLDWEGRIRHPNELPSSLRSSIVAAEWVGGFLDGLKVHFNSNLNCLIGGKGTGKSTVIETLRYGLGLIPLGEEPRRQHEGILKEVFRVASQVRILIQSHTDAGLVRYLVERSYPYDAEVYRWDNGRGEQVQGLNAKDLLKDAEVYGQKEILELSRHEEDRLKLLDRFLDPREIQDIEECEGRVLRTLRDQARLLLELDRDQETIEANKSRLAALRERLKQFETLGLKERLAEQRLYLKEEELFRLSEEALAAYGDAVRGFSSAAVVLDSGFPDPWDLEGLPHPGLHGEIRTCLDALQHRAKEAVASLIASKEAAVKDLSEIRARWEPDNRAQQERYLETLRGLETGAIDPSQYMETEKTIARLKPIVEEASKVEKKRGDLLAQRQAALAELSDLRRRAFQAKCRAADSVNKELDGILKIKLAAEGQKSAFQERLVELRSNARSDQILKIVEHADFTPIRFVQEARKGAQSIMETFDVAQGSALSLVRGCNAEILFELETVAVPPSISISLNIGTPEKPTYKELDHLSVGQRCTAILLLILLHTKYPLIIDQPEDDLDNSFIFTDIVRRLRIEKERRQFIIATHNANIPVLGDAELIQVLQAKEDRLDLEGCGRGSIDDIPMRGSVEEILEGGHEAFGFRQAKYGF